MESLSHLDSNLSFRGSTWGRGWDVPMDNVRQEDFLTLLTPFKF